MDVGIEAVALLSGGESLQGTLLSPPAAMPGVLFVHGWGGTQKHDLVRARRVAGLGCVCLTFDLRGHEATARQRETVTRDENLADLLAAYDWLAARADVDASAIAVVGISYGGYLASVLASLRPVRWLALRSPALYKDEGWTRPKLQLNRDPDLMDYRRSRLDPATNRALAACRRFTGDALLVEAELDDITPHQVMINYGGALSGARSLTTRVLAGADHGLSEKHFQYAYTDILVGWMTEMVVGFRERAAKEALRRSAGAAADGMRRPSAEVG